MYNREYVRKKPRKKYSSLDSFLNDKCENGTLNVKVSCVRGKARGFIQGIKAGYKNK